MSRNGKPMNLPPDEIAIPNGTSTVKKVDAYGWKTIDKPGKFLWLDKTLIGIDHSYQREEVNEGRVNRIAAELSWVKFGVLSVVQRGDKTYWCIDGQHRWLATMKRSDITEVPVLLFKVFSDVQEAEGFLNINCDRGAVRTFSRFNALVVSRDAAAMATHKMVETSGYKFALGGGKNTVRCLAAIYGAMKVDHAAAAVAWALCVDLFQGEPPHERVYCGLFQLERALKRREPGRSLADADNSKIIKAIGPKGLKDATESMAAALGKGGPKVMAAGIARAINKKRRSNHVPSMLSGTDDE